MMYLAEYTHLVNGATWGRKDHEIEADSDDEAKTIAFEFEQNYDDGHEGSELLLGYVYDKNGKIIWGYGDDRPE